MQDSFKKLFVMAMLSTAMPRLAGAFEIDGINYEPLTESTAQVRTESFTGHMTIPSTVTFDGKVYTVTSIEQTCNFAKELTGVTIPATVTEINQSFSRCPLIETGEVPEGTVKLIDSFRFNYAMREFTVASTVETIGLSFQQEYDHTTMLTLFLKPRMVEWLEPASLNAVVFIPKGTIGDYSSRYPGVRFKEADFSAGTDKLKPYDITDGKFCYDINADGKTCTLVPASQPYNTDGHVIIPESAGGYTVTDIYDKCFPQTDNITALTLPSGLQSIGYSNFPTKINRVYAYGQNPPQGNIRARILFYPKGASTQWEWAMQCDRRLAATLGVNDEALKPYDAMVDGVAYIYNSPESASAVWDEAPYALKGKVKIAATVNGHRVDSIGDNAFMNATGITSVDFPESIKSIGRSAFSGCTALEAITVPDAISNLDETFYGCTSLSSIDLGRSMSGFNAFEGCNNVREITVRAVIPPTFNTYSNFADEVYANATVNVIPGLRQIYATDGLSSEGEINNEFGWARFKNFREDSSLAEIITDEAGGLKFIVNPDGTAAVFPAGENPYSGAITIPESVSGHKVTEIESRAFDNCPGLTSLTIPASVMTIKSQAIRNCPSLTELILSDGDEPLKIQDSYYMSECPISKFHLGRQTYSNFYLYQLTDLTFGPAVTSVSGFGSCKTLTSVKFPEGIVSINGFDNCRNLAEVSLPATLKSISGFTSTPLKSINLPQSLTSISGFDYCESLTEISLPRNLKSISGFDNSPITTLTLPQSLTSIDGFNNCSALTEVEIPKNVTNLSGFNNCRNLKKVKIGKSVTSLSGFRDWENLEELTIGSGVRYLGEATFYPAGKFEDDEYTYFNTLNTVYCLPTVPPDGVPYLMAGFNDRTVVYVPMGSKEAYLNNEKWAGLNIREADLSDIESFDIAADGVFADISSDNTVTITTGTEDYSGDVSIPATLTVDGVTYEVTIIGVNAFANNDKLTGIDVPETVTAISDGAFSGCSALINVVIGEQVSDIAITAFEGCKSIAAIEVRNPEPPVSERINGYSRSPRRIAARAEGSGMFEPEVYENATLRVPAGSLSAYRNSPVWGRFSKIVEMESGIGEIEISNPETVIYDLNGRPCGKDINALPGGIYILRSATKTMKIKI